MNRLYFASIMKGTVGSEALVQQNCTKKHLWSIQGCLREKQLVTDVDRTNLAGRNIFADTKKNTSYNYFKKAYKLAII